MTSVGAATSLQQIIVVPRNGYVNRLQAWASSAVLAAEFDVPLRVAWEPEAIAPAAFARLFFEGRPGSTTMSPGELESLLGTHHSNLSRYLTVQESRRTIVLAGHDRGEQEFMPSLTSALMHPCEPTTLVIIAGGKFVLGDDSAFESRRRQFYRALPWSEEVEEHTSRARRGRGEFIGLHIRETDRSMSAPDRRAVSQALTTLAHETGITSVFLAADTEGARVSWLAALTALGLYGWTAPVASLDRSSTEAAIGAMVDWRVLGESRGLVFSRASTFGAEAAVAANAVTVSHDLSASPLRQRARSLARAGRSAITLPRRRLVQGKNPS